MSANPELRSLPSVDRLLDHPLLAALAGAYSRDAVAALIRQELENARQAIRSGAAAPTSHQLAEAIERRAGEAWSPWPRQVINATGVVLHTNLGRAPLSGAAVRAAADAAGGYSDLEMNMTSGKRGSRTAHISRLLHQTTGAEAGIAVNNNATAVLLGLTAMAAGREVIISRGEAVEIGGGFRIPDVLRQSGTILVEVGTTNRTYASDYEAAITPDTAAILKVHRSNFTVSGFTHDAELEELVAIGRSHEVSVLHDLGSGSLLDTARYGMAHEPTVQESVSAGADVVFFSGDKLLGGPQAGLAVGASESIELLARHPLARAIRPDKMILAALAATLTAYLKPSPEEEIPVWRMLSASVEALEARATAWRDTAGHGEIRQTLSAVGGGSLPGQTLPSIALAITPTSGADELCRRLRGAAPPVLARIEDDRVLLDPRTVLPDQDSLVINAVKTAVEQQPS